MKDQLSKTQANSKSFFCFASIDVPLIGQLQSRVLGNFP
jgi:hypothetical protein